MEQRGQPAKSMTWAGSASLPRLVAATIFLASFAGSVGDAQGQTSTVMEINGSRLAVSAQEMKALSNLGQLVRSTKTGAQDRALAEARRIASSRDARHALATYELEIGKRRGDEAMQTQALDVLIASDRTGHDRLPGYLAVRGQIAYRAGDFDTAGKLWARSVELTPSDPTMIANLAQVRLAQHDATGAMDLLARAIAARNLLGQAAPETWYRQQLSIAQQAHLVEPGIVAARAFVRAHPTPENWRAALSVYRQLTVPEGALEIDFLRLMRHMGALAQADEYQRMAQLLNQSGEPGEAKAVLDEGIKRGLLDATTSPTREIVAEVDRAVAKAQMVSGARRDQPTGAGAQVRLGRSQLLAGQPAEAEVAFRSAAGDPAGGRYADLAFFWLASLAQGQATLTAKP